MQKKMGSKKLQKTGWFGFGSWLNARSPKPGKGYLRYCQTRKRELLAFFSQEHIRTIKDSMNFRGDCCVFKINQKI